MTLAEGVLRLVRGGSRVDSHRGRTASVRAADAISPVSETAAAVPAAEVEPAAGSGGLTANAQPFDLDALLAARASETLAFAGTEPGFADLEAAVALVESGLARRVVLHGFESWPGLLWRAYELAEAADVLILPTEVHPGGRVDIAVTGNHPIDG